MNKNKPSGVVQKTYSQLFCIPVPEKDDGDGTMTAKDLTEVMTMQLKCYMLPLVCKRKC